MKAPWVLVVNRDHLGLERKGTEVRGNSFTRRVSYIHFSHEHLRGIVSQVLARPGGQGHRSQPQAENLAELRMQGEHGHGEKGPSHVGWRGVRVELKSSEQAWWKAECSSDPQASLGRN